MTKRILFMFIVLSAAHSASAKRIKSTEEMTCAAVIRQVAATNRYYKASVDGPLPMYPIYAYPDLSKGEGWACGGRTKVWHEIVSTLDTDQCYAGYTCDSNGS